MDGWAVFDGLRLVRGGAGCGDGAKAGQYACLWMDSTAGGALTSPVTCRAATAEDVIPIVFTLPAEALHTTFAYRRAADTWRWTIDDLANGKTTRFADVVMAREK